MVVSPQYSFIQFSDTLDQCKCDSVLEVAELSELSFYIEIGLVDIVTKTIPGAIDSTANPIDSATVYNRTPIGTDDMIKINLSSSLYYSGKIESEAYRGVSYYNSSKQGIAVDCGKIQTYNKFKLTIPDGASYIASCSFDDLPALYELSTDNKLFLCNISGDIIDEIQNIGSGGWINPQKNLSEYLACNDCFRLMIITINGKYYSNIFQYNPDTIYPLVRYRSNISQYFPYGKDIWNSLRLPVLILNRNPKTDKEEYIDANGRIRNPFKQRRHQYDLDVDYNTVEFHEKLEVLLMHNEIYIEDIELNETGDYEINYDEVIVENNIKLYKASSEMSTQDILLMRNY